MQAERQNFVSSVVISKWKGEFLENIASVFEKDNVKRQEEGPDLDQLYSQIGQSKVDNDFLKKVAGSFAGNRNGSVTKQY